MILTLIKCLLLILPIASSITIKFKYHQEESVLIAYLSTLFILYILGIFNILSVGIYLLIIIAIATSVYDIYALAKKKIKITELLTLPIIIYTLVLFIICFFLKGSKFHDWDEMSHWGTNLKFMVSKDLLWANKEFNGIHIVYQPLIGIAEWITNKLNGGFVEDISYLGYEIFVCTLILPLLKNLKYNFMDTVKCILVFTFILLTRLIFGFPLVTIYIDYVLALLFGISFYIALKCKENKDYVLLFMLLIALVLLKDTGLLFAGIIIMYLFIFKVIARIIRDKKISKETLKIAGTIIGCLIILIMIYMSWKFYCNMNGQTLDVGHDHNYISENLDIKSLIKSIVQSDSTEGKLNTIAKTFFEYLTNTEFIKIFIEFTSIKMVVMLNILGIIAYLINEKENKKKIVSMILSFNIGLILYLVLLLVTYLFAMTDAEGYRLASIDRYLNTYYLSWFIVSCLTIFESEKFKKVSLIVLIIVNLLLIGDSNVFNAINSNYRTNTIPDDLIALSCAIKDKVNEDDKIYLIVQNSSQKFIQHQVRYLLSPISTNDMSEFSLGERYNEEDYDSIDITEKQWEEKLIKDGYDYVLIVDGDEKFYNKFKEIFDDPGNSIEDVQRKLFKIEKIDDNNVRLIKEAI